MCLQRSPRSCPWPTVTETLSALVIVVLTSSRIGAEKPSTCRRYRMSESASRRLVHCRHRGDRNLADMVWLITVATAASVCQFPGNITGVVGQSTLAPAERAALVDLYLATNGSGWRGNMGWSNYTNSSSDPCVDRWTGVTCTNSSPNHVVYVIFCWSDAKRELSWKR